MPFFIHYAAFLLTFSIVFADPGRTILLTQDKNPSYALHGRLLAEYKDVQIVAFCANCTLLVDVTLRDYNADPFRINGFDVDLSSCVANLNDTIDTLKTCQYSYRGEVLFSIGNSTINEFGLSVRVSEWSPATNFFVFPEPERRPLETAGATVYVGNNNTVSVATFVAWNTTNPCTMLLDFVVVPSDRCMAYIVPGATPANIPRLADALVWIDGTRNTGMNRILSSSFSVVVPADCFAAVKTYGWLNEYNFNGYLDTGAYSMTSPEFPYLYDNPNRHKEYYEQKYTRAVAEQMLPFDFQVTNLFGGQLDIMVTEKYQNGFDYRQYNYTSTVPGRFANISGHEVLVQWYPNQDDQPKGFMLTMETGTPLLAPTAPAPTVIVNC
ncbi:unnamed protein product, partial [Mesorhabditis spiculigera]